MKYKEKWTKKYRCGLQFGGVMLHQTGLKRTECYPYSFPPPAVGSSIEAILWYD